MPTTSDAVQPSKEQTELEGLFQRCFQYVRRNMNSIENDYVHPAVDSYKTCFKNYPILTLFASVFALYATLPVFLFIGATATVIFFTALLGILFVMTVSISSIMVFGCILVGTLFTLGFFAAISSASLITAYISFRLIAHLRAGGYAAVGGWSQEMRGTFIEKKKNSKSANNSHRAIEHPSTGGGSVKKESSEDSDMSVVSSSEKHTVEGLGST